VEEAERRKVSVYEVLKDAFECYEKEKEGSNVSLEVDSKRTARFEEEGRGVGEEG
jgi:hypothetical protein